MICDTLPGGTAIQSPGEIFKLRIEIRVLMATGSYVRHIQPNDLSGRWPHCPLPDFGVSWCSVQAARRGGFALLLKAGKDAAPIR